MKTLFVLLLLFAASLSSANAQAKLRKFRIIRLDPATNQYQEINMKGIYRDQTYNMQDAITAVDKDGVEHILTTDSIEGFVVNGDYYIRKTITFKGDRMTKFLLREDVYKDENIRVYSYEEKNSLKTYYYVEFADNGEPLLMKQSGIERIKEELLKNPNASDKMTQRMIADMKPTADGVRKVHKALYAGGYGHMQRFRWGISAVGGIGKVNTDKYELDAKMLATAGIFAEIPIASKISLVPELYLTKMSVKGKKADYDPMKNSVVYNRMEVSVPLMLRYTMFNVRGKFIPYAQVGVATSFGLKQNFDYRQVVEEHRGSYEIESYVMESSEDLPLMQANALAGIGTEYIISNKSSLFFELRGALGFSLYGRNDIMFVVGLKL